MTCKHSITYLGSIYSEKTGERLGCGTVDIVCERGYEWHMILCSFGLGRLCKGYTPGKSQCEFTAHDPIQRQLQDERITRAIKKQKELGTYDYKREELWIDMMDCMHEMFGRCDFV